MQQKKAGLWEICFTDHLDYDPLEQMGVLAFDTAAYNAEYDHLEIPELTIRKDLEINTSGIDSCGDFLSGAEYLRLFQKLGGKIVTVDSDAHASTRVGQYADHACQLAKEIFGYVCTFADRKPIFHTL